MQYVCACVTEDGEPSDQRWEGVAVWEWDAFRSLPPFLVPLAYVTKMGLLDSDVPLSLPLPPLPSSFLSLSPLPEQVQRTKRD